jgi:hypothetical protein
MRRWRTRRPSRPTRWLSACSSPRSRSSSTRSSRARVSAASPLWRETLSSCWARSQPFRSHKNPAFAWSLSRVTLQLCCCNRARNVFFHSRMIISTRALKKFYDVVHTESLAGGRFEQRIACVQSRAMQHRVDPCCTGCGRSGLLSHSCIVTAK